MTMAPDLVVRTELDGPYAVAASILNNGLHLDPTFRSRPGSVHFAARTPEGPAAARATTVDDALVLELWGDGAGWMGNRGPLLAAHHDDSRRVRFDHDRLDDVHRRNLDLRHGAHGAVVDTLLARIVGQRVRSTEAGHSWAALCGELGDRAPGPLDLRLAPDPERVAQTPTWWFHQHGVERKRAEVLVGVARRATRLAQVVDLPLPEAYRRMRAVPGLGPWTVNGAARAALGDPDAIIVGDYWISHIVCSFLTGTARGSDEEMLSLVERWAGQRGRVERLVHASGHKIQRFGPGRDTPRIAQL